MLRFQALIHSFTVDKRNSKGHSTRAVSSSKVESTGLLVSDILNRGLEVLGLRSQHSRDFIINQLLVEMRHISNVF